MHKMDILSVPKIQDCTICKAPWSKSYRKIFNIHQKNCQRWLDLELENPNKHCRKFNKGQGRKISYSHELEEQLVKWILEKREESNIAVSTEMIRLKGLSLITPSVLDFQACDSWLRKFLSRNNLVLRAKTSMAQILQCDLEEKIAQFRQNIWYVHRNGDFPYD